VGNVAAAANPRSRVPEQ